LPLAHVRVVEMSHMVMGPTVGLVLGDLGADVVKIEPLGGDKTRRLRGSGAGYFVTYNRNKRSVTANTKLPADRARFEELIAEADAVVSRFTFEARGADGRTVSVRGLTYYRLADGRIVEDDPITTPELTQELGPHERGPGGREVSLFGEVDVAEDPDEDGHGAAVLLTEDPADVLAADRRSFGHVAVGAWPGS
jgi:hypothetical protein